jgi:outer membrane protein assembly factor BamB
MVAIFAGARHGAAILASLLPLLLMTSLLPADQERFQQHVAVDAPADVAKALAAAESDASQGQWNAALDRLLVIRDSQGDALVEVQPGWYRRAADQVRSIIADWPAEGRTAYQKRMEPRLRRELESAIASDDDRKLSEIGERDPWTRVGAEALDRHARHCWRQGRLSEARRAWRLILSQPADPDSPMTVDHRAGIAACLVLCTIVEHDFSRAAEELDVYREQFGNSVGAIGGETGALSDLLQKQLDITRSQFAAERPPVISSLGSAKWAYDAGTTSLHRPVSDESRIFLISDDAIAARMLATGEPAWPSGDKNDDAVIYRSPEPRTEDDVEDWAPTSSATISDGFLFAIVGTNTAGGELNAVPSTRRLIALDIGRGEGRLVWEQGPEDALAEAGWTIEGPPAAHEESVWIAIRKTATGEIGVACLNAADGRPRWIQPVCTPIDARANSAASNDLSWIALGEGRLCLQTAAGAIAGLRTDDGRLDWVATYPLNKSKDPRMRPISAGQPIVDCGLIFAAPADAGGVLAFDRDSGQPRWATHFADRILQLAGVSEGRLIVAGRGLTGLDPRSGQPAWRIRFADIDGASAGEPAIVGSTIVWSTRTEILLVNARTGEVLDRAPLRDRYNTSGGSVLAAQAQLIISQPHGVTIISPR